MHLFQSVLLPDGTPDVHLRTARGGQKLRNIMLDANMELYGPYVSCICHAINNSCPLFMLLKECLYMHISIHILCIWIYRNELYKLAV